MPFVISVSELNKVDKTCSVGKLDADKCYCQVKTLVSIFASHTPFAFLTLGEKSLKLY